MIAVTRHDNILFFLHVQHFPPCAQAGPTTLSFKTFSGAHGDEEKQRVTPTCRPYSVSKGSGKMTKVRNTEVLRVPSSIIQAHSIISNFLERQARLGGGTVPVGGGLVQKIKIPDVVLGYAENLRVSTAGIKARMTMPVPVQVLLKRPEMDIEARYSSTAQEDIFDNFVSRER